MDFVDGTSPDALTRAQFAEVKEAIMLLHSKNLVFGDLCPPNILVKDGKVMIIDFDWCGKAGNACYPAELNLERELGWPLGVQPGSIMQKEHDLFMLKKLKVQE
jgi:serine/threonine protein kinase